MGSQAFSSYQLTSSFIDLSYQQLKLWIPATAKPAHPATVTHVPIVASALAILLIANVASRVARNEWYNNKGNNNNDRNVKNNLATNAMKVISRKPSMFSRTFTIPTNSFYITRGY